MPVLGSGHPQADIFLVKYSARPSEVEEGVAFYGRAGNALMKSLKRLSIDPLAVYGTLCVKCPCLTRCWPTPRGARLVEAIRSSRRARGRDGRDALSVVNELDLPLAGELHPAAAQLQRLTPSIEALYVPNIDDSLDEESASGSSGQRSGWLASGGGLTYPLLGTGRMRLPLLRGTLAAMDLEEKSLDQIGDRCEECGAKLTPAEIEAAMESGGPALCTVHADEVVPLGDEAEGFGED